jgi:peptidoglycan/LPS O-acetylase OafA/YrhL
MTEQVSARLGLWGWLNAADNHLLPERAGYGYIPGLDGLRAIAVLIVIVAHFGLDHIVPGGFGVTVFFFISGFLITRLLIAEGEAKGKVELGKFYLRRFARLYPALLFMVFGSTAYFMAMGYGGPSVTELLAAIFYFTNIFQVSAVASGGEMPFMSWTHLWSLAVEEHFYLLFPLVVISCGALINRLRLSVIAVLVIVPLWRLFTFSALDVPVADYNYMMTDARIDSIAWGCLLTIILHEAGRIAKFRWLIGVVPVAVALVALLATFVVRDEAFRHVLRYSVQGASLFVLVLNFYYLSALRLSVRVLELQPFVWLGRVSYGLYLWHFPVIDASRRMFGAGLLSITVAIIATLVITAFSFYVVEQPFNRLRKRLGSHIPARP